MSVERSNVRGCAPRNIPIPKAGFAGAWRAAAANFCKRIAEGYHVYDYRWAEGLGEVSREIDYRQSNDTGTTGVTVITIRHLTALATSSDPTSSPGAGFVKIGEAKADQDGYRLWTVTWAKGTGTVVTDVRSENQGKLVIYHRVALGTAPSAPSATIGGTVTLIRDDSRKDSGYDVYDRTWAEGKGVIHKEAHGREGGLRLETWVSLGQGYDASFMKPDGILAQKDNDDLEGVTRWTVTCWQSNSGGDPTSGTALSYTTKRPFTYPGRAKAITTNADALSTTKNCYDIYQSPPVTVLVTATVKITYQSSATMPSPDHTLWNPDVWATIYAKFWAWNAYPKVIIQSLPGYRAVSETAITFNGGGTTGYNESCLGERVYGINSGTPYSLAVKGGPAAPDGNTYTIEPPSMEPAFLGFDGTQYFRVTQVYATIPSQTALPV